MNQVLEALKNCVTQNGLAVADSAGIIGLVFAIGMIVWIVRQSPGNNRMKEVAAAILEGANAYLRRQVLTVSFIAVIIAALIYFFYPSKETPSWHVSVGFLVGAACSLLSGYVGMRIAVIANVRTAQAASKGTHQALRVAFNGGAVTGLLVVAMGLLSVSSFYYFFHDMRAMIGLALGASLVSVFARLGGGIYTKAADVGADLVGKIESGLDEDDPRNPAVIADNVGDNVGDCAGMAADVFETYAVSLIGAMLVGALTLQVGGMTTIFYPLLLGAISIVGLLFSILAINFLKGKPMFILSGGVAMSAAISAILYYPVTHWLFPAGIKTATGLITANSLYFASLVGLVMTAVVVVITDYYTSTSYGPVQKIAKASETGHATNIIAGLAVGQHATALPVGFIGIAILLSYHFAGLYGIAIAVVSMLSLAGIIISLDAFGPITDNAGGIAVMSGLPKNVRSITDHLEALGNTLKAVTKGYAIASAGLASLVLFGSYVEELKSHWLAKGSTELLKTLEFSLQEPKVIIGLFIGGLLPFMFTALCLDSVGKAAGAVVREVRRQIKAKPGILKGKDKPDYATCVDIV
ncbi:MAG: sodium-translocating pyrophosphatase, partial [Spirochaetia bacterium]|nr:sodium-translocating pyrophosphatase [Spirochaetia bacterium]